MTVRLNNARIEGLAGSGVITHDHPDYPQANRTLTFQSSLPSHISTANDNTGRAFNHATSGFWVTTSHLSTPNRSEPYNIGWSEVESGDDVTLILTDILTDNANTFIKAPLDGGIYIIDAADWSSLTTLTLEFLNSDSGKRTIYRPKRWEFSDDLRNLDWEQNETTENSNEWSTTISVDTPVRLFIKDVKLGHPLNTSVSWKGPWLVDSGAQSIGIASWDRTGQWLWDSANTKLRVYAESNVSTEFDEIRYLIDHPDRLFKTYELENFYWDSNIIFQGNRPGAQIEPMMHKNNIDSANSDRFISMTGNQANFNPSRGEFEFKGHIKATFGLGIFMSYDQAGGLNRGITTVNANGCFFEQSGAVINGAVTINLLNNPELRSYFKDRWDGKQSPTGLSDTGITNVSGVSANPDNTYWGGAQPGIWQTIGTGTMKGTGLGMQPTFALSGGAGDNIANPLILTHRNLWYSTQPIGYNYLFNERPTFYDDNNSAENLVGKTDGIGNVLGTYFIRLIDIGVVDWDTDEFVFVDIDDGGTPIQNVSSNHAITQLYSTTRPGHFLFESTAESEDARQLNNGAYIELQGNFTQGIRLSALERWHPADQCHSHYCKQFGTEEIHGSIIRASQNCTIDSISQNVTPVAITSIVGGHDEDHQLARNNTYKNGINKVGKIVFGSGEWNSNVINYTFTGISRKVIEISDPIADRFRDDDITLVDIDNLTNAPTNSTIDTESGSAATRKKAFARVDGILYDLPYTFGGSNISNANAIPSLKRLGYAHWPTLGETTSATFHMPSYVKEGEGLVCTLIFDADPGVITFTDWDLESGLSVNDGLTWIEVYKRTAGAGEENIQEDSILWTNSSNLLTHVLHFRGQTANIIGQVATQINANLDVCATPAFANTLSNGSLVIGLGAWNTNNFSNGFIGTGGDSDWNAASMRQKTAYFGQSFQDNTDSIQKWNQPTGPGYACGQKYATSNSINSLNMFFTNANSNSIAIAFEILDNI